MQKIEIEKRALIARINRKLNREGKKLRAARSRVEKEIGDYLIVTNAGISDSLHARSLESLARKIGVLAPYETAGR
jgi:hypothetical protein